MATVKLTARNDFKSGETGYATGTTVGRARDGFVPADGRLVRALEDVRNGESGSFEEIESQE
jgi:hypothetical protein